MSRPCQQANAIKPNAEIQKAIPFLMIFLSFFTQRPSALKAVALMFDIKSLYEECLFYNILIKITSTQKKALILRYSFEDLLR